MNRSVFDNFNQAAAAQPPSESPTRRGADGAVSPSSGSPTASHAAARSFLYRALAQGFEDPSTQVWEWFGRPETETALRAAVQTIDSDGEWDLMAGLKGLIDARAVETLELLQIQFVSAFGHAARGQCPLNEIEYGDIKADPLFQPHRLADLAAFYRAFGMELTENAGERQDHLSIELEFMAVLAAKEAYALEQEEAGEALEVCRAAQRSFMREHLGRWSPAFSRRLARMTGSGFLGALAGLLRSFIAAECALLKVRPGSEDLLLRPVDEAGEALCDSCGLPGKTP